MRTKSHRKLPDEGFIQAVHEGFRRIHELASRDGEEMSLIECVRVQDLTLPPQEVSYVDKEDGDVR